MDCPLLVCSWAWCAACCRGAPTSALRRPTSLGLPCSRSWSWRCPAEWPSGSAPAPIAPRPWAAPRASHRLPEPQDPFEVKPPHFSRRPSAGLPPLMSSTLPRWRWSSETKSCSVTLFTTILLHVCTPLCCPRSDFNPNKWCEGIF